MNHSTNRALAPELRERHYVLHSPKHPRRWVAFSTNKVEAYRAKFADDFCLVVTGDPHAPGDFYAIPWRSVSLLFTEANRFPAQQNNRVSYRWQIHLEGRAHHFQMELSPADSRQRPQFDASEWYGNLTVLGLSVEEVGTPAAVVEIEEDFSALEGREKLAIHHQRERDPALAQHAKRNRLTACGRLCCDVCEFDFAKVYGSLGDGFIEAHHTLPLRELREETRTSINDLALVCANCHRMLHRGKTWLSIEQLRALLREAQRGS